MTNITKKYTALLLVTIFLIFTSCLRRDLDGYTGPEIEELLDFDYATTKEFHLQVTTLDTKQDPLTNVAIEVYTEPPISYNSDSAYKFTSAPIVSRGTTDKFGEYFFDTALPTHLSHLYLYIDYTGLPQFHVLDLESQSISLTFNLSDSIRSDENLKGLSYKNTLEEKYIGSWSTNGIPNYREVRDTIDSNYLEKVNATLTPGEDLAINKPEYLNSDNQRNLIILEDCEIYMTFVSESSGWNNVLGYYTYETDEPLTDPSQVIDQTIAIPNVTLQKNNNSTSQNILVPGDKIQLQYWNRRTNTFSNTFPAGTTLGWYLKADAWNLDVMRGLYTHYTNYEWNNANLPENRQQHVLLYDEMTKQLLLGFEDIKRDNSWSDNDFNDATFYTTVLPTSAISTSQYPKVVHPVDTDKDGVPDKKDNYPNDINKAFNNYYPSSETKGTLAFEDSWPLKDDDDFNDLVVEYQINQITNSDNRVVQIEADFTLKAAGSNLANGFGFELNALINEIKSVSGTSLSEDYIVLNENGVENGHNKAVIILFDNIRNEITSQNLEYFNTQENGSHEPEINYRISIELSTPLNMDLIGAPPYNPFVIVNGNRGHEIHLLNQEPTRLADQTLFGTEQDNSEPSIGKYYNSKKFLPWGINIPNAFNYPLEGKSLTGGYLLFEDWASSLGHNYPDWYLNKEGYRNNSNLYTK